MIRIDKTRFGPESTISDMLEHERDSTEVYIDDIDAMARAVYLWVRQQCFQQRFLGSPVSQAEKTNLAAGFIAGLRARLGLPDRESALLAYVYALMAGEDAAARRTARLLVDQESAVMASCSGYLHGLEAAHALCSERRIQ